MAYRDDMPYADLVEEIGSLKAQKAAAEKERDHHKRVAQVEKIKTPLKPFLITLLVVFTACLPFTLIAVTCGSSYREGCYVETSHSRDTLGYVLLERWRFNDDETIGYFSNIDEALVAAAKLKCNVIEDGKKLRLPWD